MSSTRSNDASVSAAGSRDQSEPVSDRSSDAGWTAPRTRLLSGSEKSAKQAEESGIRKRIALSNRLSGNTGLVVSLEHNKGWQILTQRALLPGTRGGTFYDTLYPKNRAGRSRYDHTTMLQQSLAQQAEDYVMSVEAEERDAIVEAAVERAREHRGAPGESRG